MQQRQSNMELCRIVAIVMVLVLHSDFAVFGWPETMLELHVPLLFAECFCIVAVPVFVMISGYFSIHLKLKSVVNLAYICLFCAMLKFLYNAATNQPFDVNNLFFISRSNWFIPVYLGLVVFSPILNAVCEKLDKRQFSIMMCTIMFYHFYMGWFPARPQLGIGVNGGCSLYEFTLFYLVGRYIRLYGVCEFIKKHSFLLYVLVCSFWVIAYYLMVYYGFAHYAPRLLWGSSPFMVFGSACVLLTFERINIQSKVINHISKSVLAVLLLHSSKAGMGILRPIYQDIFENYNWGGALCLWAITIAGTFATCVIIDQLRLVSYNYLQKIFFH
jgi:surface polysaccharide O-acyltransferase-like enzyme